METSATDVHKLWITHSARREWVKTQQNSGFSPMCRRESGIVTGFGGGGAYAAL